MSRWDFVQSKVPQAGFQKPPPKMKNKNLVIWKLNNWNWPFLYSFVWYWSYGEVWKLFDWLLQFIGNWFPTIWSPCTANIAFPVYKIHLIVLKRFQNLIGILKDKLKKPHHSSVVAVWVLHLWVPRVLSETHGKDRQGMTNIKYI